MSLSIDWTALRPEAIPFVLFGLRALDLTLATLRVMALIRGRARLAWIVGAFEAVLFVLGAAGLLTNLSNPWNILAYAGGFATGNVIGMTLERGLMPGHSLLRIYSAGRGEQLAAGLRKVGRGVTEVPARGREGMVDLIFCYVPSGQSRRAQRQAMAIDPEAVINVENVRALVGGWGA